MAGRLEGKVAFVTGGASGIGEATIRLFASEGARVVIADIQDELGEKIAAELGENALYQHTDVRSEESVAAAIDASVAAFGQLDCVFANAAIVGALGSITELPAEEWDFTMDVNLRGVFFCMKYAARVMKPRETGSIISTVSVAAIQGGMGPHAYAAAKSAVAGLTRNVAAELAPQSIRVNCIAATNCATEMIAGMVFGDTSQVGVVEQGLAATSPFPNRACVPDDIARAALYLASDDASLVSGHTLVVDAGLTMGTGWKNAGLYDGHTPMVREAGQRGLPGD